MNNNKGFTLVELVLSFALIMIVIMGMLTIIMNYKLKANLQQTRSSMLTYKDTLTKDIQDDIHDLGVSSIAACTTNPDTCIDINFVNSTTKKLYTNKTDLRNKYIIYGDIIYKIEDDIPQKVDNTTLATYQNIELLPTATPILNTYVGSSKTIYTISIPIINKDLDKDFGIYITVVK